MTIIAGVDEAGRGPWAGPVVVAAVILSPKNNIDGLDDSKKLTALKRDKLFDIIIAEAQSYAWQFIQVPQIDKFNILGATLLGMRLSVLKLAVQPDQVLVDGRDVPKLPMPAAAIIGGDGKVAEISAASILAKVIRDRYMQKLGIKYPEYGFASHKGYGTKQHQQALAKHGTLIHHRKSFAPIKKIILENKYNQEAKAL
ncbi:MAG: ribonuclease HII [Legionellales bacterium]|jgi:ribonuclease HII|nr:ribonuclease HII [Legionellales bacterium]